MDFRIEFDEAALQRIAQDAKTELARRAQPDLDSFVRENEGSDPATVKPKLECLLAERAMQVDIQDLDQWTAWACEGRRIVLQVE